MMTARAITTIALVASIFSPALPLTLAAQAQEPAMTPQQLIKDVVYNELRDHKHHAYFQYLDEKREGQQTTLRAEIETRTGRIHRMLAQDGQPLTPEQQDQEARRLERLLHDPGQQQKLLRDYQSDEDRIARIVALLPDGFLYRFDGAQGDNIRLKYEPNPAFKPPTYEARVFHCMAGTLWVNAREKRLSRLNGTLTSNVDFGYGLLGRLYKGGTFNLERFEAAPGSWKTRVLDVHIDGHLILLKSINEDQTERRSDFHQVPATLTLQQAAATLPKSIAPETRSASADPAAPYASRSRKTAPEAAESFR